VHLIHETFALADPEVDALTLRSGSPEPLRYAAPRYFVAEITGETEETGLQAWYDTYRCSMGRDCKLSWRLDCRLETAIWAPLREF
jgi:hypothetical protein